MTTDAQPAIPPTDERRGDLTPDRHTWTPLRYLNFYRVVLAASFALLVYLDVGPEVFGRYDPGLFLTTSLAYLAAGLACAATIYLRAPAFPVQVYGQILIDFIAITLLMHASGGIGSGLGMLFVVAIAGGSLLTVGRTAIAFAAAASLFVLLSELYAQLERISETTYYTQAGMLGVTFFATAILAHLLARRIRESEELAARRGTDLAVMEQLADYVIERMQTGILILDRDGRIKLANDSARHLLGLKDITTALPTELLVQLAEWIGDGAHASAVFRVPTTGAELLPRFASLGARRSGEILVFLEDTATTAQQAQQMKLASLGRLTASIAHEIRNPLGAISHAGQLLAESPGMESGDRRLTQIIRDQSKRMNTIIENVLRLSRRGQTQPEEFELKPWLTDFHSEFTRSHQIDPVTVTFDVKPADVRVRIDRTQLHQILWNLCENGLKHSRPATGVSGLTIEGGLLSDSNNPYLAVIDNGQGIAPEVAQHMFEPFFTTESGGTGLGLYIARELCEANQARLSYNRAAHGGGCFRIVFADPRRRQVA